MKKEYFDNITNPQRKREGQSDGDRQTESVRERQRLLYSNSNANKAFERGNYVYVLVRRENIIPSSLLSHGRM